MSAPGANVAELKTQIVRQIDRRKAEYIQLSHDIHARPETGNREFYAAGRLTELLQREGFTVASGVAGHPTGFIARRESKLQPGGAPGPAIGFLAEYDALPEIGHGCGHNIIGAASAAAAPEKGVNALDGVIQLFNGINALRQQLPPDVRIHGIITHGGEAPNIIPAYAKARFFVRAATRRRCDEATDKVKAIAQGAALATGTKVSVTYFQNQVDDFVSNRRFDTLFQEVTQALGAPIALTAERGIGSTDAGNVSHVVPTIHPSLQIGPPELVAHSPEFCNAAKSPQGDEALILGAKTLAITGLILLSDEQKLQEIKAEFAQNKISRDYIG